MLVQLSFQVPDFQLIENALKSKNSIFPPKYDPTTCNPFAKHLSIVTEN